VIVNYSAETSERERTGAKKEEKGRVFPNTLFCSVVNNRDAVSVRRTGAAQRYGLLCACCSHCHELN